MGHQRGEDVGRQVVLWLLVGLALLLGAVPARAADMDCSDFSSQASAQAFFLANGGPAADPHRLDADGDGVACESLPCPCATGAPPPPPAPTPPAPPVPPTEPVPPADPEPAPDPPPTPDPAPEAELLRGRITAVVDGDTIKVAMSSPTRRRYTVRLIGIDTPETRRPGTPVECGGKQASSNMYRLAFTRPRDRDGDGLLDHAGGLGRQVTLRTDPTQDRTDRYGRLLAYVTPTGRPMLQLAQLSAGWASVYVFGNAPFEQHAAFQRTSRRAQTARRGVWRSCAGDFHRPASSP